MASIQIWHVDVTGPEDVPYLRPLSTCVYKKITLSLSVLMFLHSIGKWLDIFNSNFACRCNWPSRSALQCDFELQV